MWLIDRRCCPKLPASPELRGPGGRGGGGGLSPGPTEAGPMRKHLCEEFRTLRARGPGLMSGPVLMCRQTLAQTCIRNLATCINYPRTATRVQGDHSGTAREPGRRRGWRGGRYRRHGHTPAGRGTSEQTDHTSNHVFLTQKERASSGVSPPARVKHEGLGEHRRGGGRNGQCFPRNPPRERSLRSPSVVVVNRGW